MNNLSSSDINLMPESANPIQPTPKSHTNFAAIFIAGIIIVGILGGAAYILYALNQNKSADNTNSNTTQQENLPTRVAQETTTISVKEEGKLVLPNGHADPTVLKTDIGFRMYVNRQSGGPTGILTYISTDGIAWTKEQDIIIPGASTSRAIAMDSGVRLFYPGAQPINPNEVQDGMKSSFSTDGKTFSTEAGVRLTPRDGYYVEGPTVFQLADGSWKMYFNENSIAAGNNRDGEIWGATSTDGKTWIRDDQPTLVADSVESKVEGRPAPWKQVLHPFVIQNPSGGYIMFYNSHSEIYAATSKDGKTWDKLGAIGIHGADIDGYFIDDHTMRVYYGDFSEQTGGLVYSAILEIK